MAKYFAGGTYEEQARDPVNVLLGSGQYRDIRKSDIDAYFKGDKSQEETIAAIKGTPIFNPNIGLQMDLGQGNVPYDPKRLQLQAGINDAKAKAGEIAAGIDRLNNPTAQGALAKAQGLIASVDNIGMRGAGIEDILKQSLEKLNARPTPQSSVELYKQYRNELGLGQIENDLSSAKNNLANLQNKILAEKDVVKTTPGLTRAYIQGRLVSIDAETTDALRQAQSAVQSAADSLNLKTHTVETLTNFAREDAKNLSDAWDTKFSQNLQLFNVLSGAQNRAEDNARAQSKTILDMFKDKPFDESTIPADTLAQWNKNDLLAGQGVGFTLGLLKLQAQNPKLNVDFWRKDNDGVTTVYAQDKTTGKSVAIQTIGSTGGGITTDIESKLLSSKGTDGFVNPDIYLKERQNSKIGPDEFDKRFGYLLSDKEKARLGIGGSVIQTQVKEERVKELMTKSNNGTNLDALTPEELTELYSSL